MEYRLSEIAHIVAGELHGEDRVVRSISTDSRSYATSEALFVAMKGKNHDSHLYVKEMIDRGVKSLLVERDLNDESNPDTTQESTLSYIVVPHSITALQRLATHHRAQFAGKVVGITGSNGKSTIKEWIAQLAPSSIKLFRSPRSYNSQLGVALSLLMIEGDEDIALIEAGISRPNEMSRLEEMIRPDITVITSIGEAHQEGFISLEEKIEEKLILANRSQTIIYNSSYSELITPILYRKGEIIDAAEEQRANLDDEASRRNSQIVKAVMRKLDLATPNFERITPIAMRLEMIAGVSDSLIINDSYNSDINSLTIALNTLKSVADGRPTTIILSDILESGREPRELYGRVAKAIEEVGVDRLIGIGEHISRWGELFSCEKRLVSSTEELLSQLTSDDFAGRAILLKGSREMRFENIAHRLSLKSHTTMLEVNLDAMVENLNYYRSHLSPTTKLVAMVKASSYGAGESEIAQILQHQGVNYLAVAFADEGSRLRERGITMPIIVLNADDGSFSQMVDSRLEPEIYSLRSLTDFATAVVARGERDYPIHIKLDTGMHRLGFMESEIEDLASTLSSLSGVVHVASIFSHLSSSDMGEDGLTTTQSQISLFDKMSLNIKSLIGYKTLRHIANSAAIIEYPESHFDMCRLGIGLYGFGAEKSLRPISTLKTRIVQIRKLESGEAVGYGGAGRVIRPSRIATIPIGYADGIDRHLGGGAWEVIVGEHRAPTIGRICMDSTMIDVTDIDGVNEGDEVTIFSAIEGNRASDMAQQLGTISYEVLTSISTRVKRIYIKE